MGGAGRLVGVAAGLFVSWWIIMGMFGTSFAKAMLAWLPTLPVAFLNVGILAAILVPTLQQGNELTNRTICMSNLKSIGMAIMLYQNANNGQMPANFEALIADGQPPKLFVCPSVDPASRRGRTWDYIYLPFGPAGGNRIIACDFLANHRGIVRNVLFADGHIDKVTEVQFQALLARPENADSAIALRAIEIMESGHPEASR
jgi:prepilin-type processing-associated H-X9-DG protein